MSFPFIGVLGLVLKALPTIIYITSFFSVLISRSSVSASFSAARWLLS
ncbi:MAG TPA: hypothetical protein VJB88_03635 [Vicinamibacteria bacterium]|nr:hypothetical protein [Vicinamibacteria bacterium]